VGQPTQGSNPCPSATKFANKGDFKMALVQIDGFSGTGKSTLAIELQKRGYEALDTDSVFGYFGNPETGQPTDEHIRLNWIWDLDRIRNFAKNSENKTIFLCGGAMNQDTIRDLFAKRFTLVIDDVTM
jgi:gluconate kinase